MELDFLTEYSWNSTWANQTSHGVIKIPKNLYYRDETNQFNPLNGTKINVGGFSSEPLFLRGDKITLTSGYKYLNSAKTPIVETKEIINGYISKVHSSIPIELEIEDNMWILKQTPMKTRTFTESDTLESLLQFIVDTANEKHGTSLTASALTKTTYGTILVGNETASELLDRLGKLYGFKSYFRDNELRCGVLRYNPSDASRQIFVMNGIEGNVIGSDQDLEYNRKDDIVLSAIAYNTVTEMDGFCKDGVTPKKVKNRLEVLVTYKNGEKTSKVIEKGDRVPDNTEGERRTFFFPEAQDTEKLKDLAFEQLDRYYYDGFKGSFITFGIPYVRHGDHVEIRNPELPEQNGVYKVKSVEYTGGVDGLRQKIELDFKII